MSTCISCEYVHLAADEAPCRTCREVKDEALRGACTSCEYGIYPEDMEPCASCVAGYMGFSNFKPRTVEEAPINKFRYLNEWRDFLALYNIPTEIVQDNKHISLRINENSIDTNIKGEFSTSSIVIDVDFDKETGAFCRLGAWDI